MRDLIRIARFQAALVRRNPAVIGTHLLGMTGLVSLSAVQIRSEQADAGTLLTVLLLAAATGGPLSIGVHTLVGERFRGTLEPLLALPVRRTILFAGKAVVVLLVAALETLGVVAFFWTYGSITANGAILEALGSTQILLVLIGGAPLLALLLTLIVLIVSGRARDAQNASNLALVIGAPVTAVVLGLWFAAGPLGPAMAGVAIAVTSFFCAVAARLAAAWLTDDRLLSRRG